MDCEWDEAKRQANILKHGIDFVEAMAVFTGRIEEREDRRRDYGERGYIAFGESAGRVIQIVYTLRNGRRRIISARKAKRNERRAYYESEPRAGQKNEKPN